MKLGLAYPDFYREYDWSPKNDKGVLFTGREIELQYFWLQMHNLVAGDGKQNLAFVGHRKLGKTTFLKRCYNLAFWEQENVMPFYYSFPQQENGELFELQTIVEKTSLELLQQAVAFMTKDPEVFDLKHEELVYDYIVAKKMPKASIIVKNLRMTKEKRRYAKGPDLLAMVWETCDDIASIWGKKTMIIIDEAQEMDLVLCQNGKLCPCGNSICDIIQQDHILTIVSGSLVSILVHKFLGDKKANRFYKATFAPLKEHHAYQLIQELVQDQGYPDIAKDVYELVGGHPYYIRTLLTPTMQYAEVKNKVKSFGSQQELKEIFDFEVFHSRGTIYDFWRRHLVKYSDSLNNDPKDKKGLAVKILYKIVTSEKSQISFDEIAKELNVKISQVKEKILQLRDADLVEALDFRDEALKIADQVLGVVLASSFQKILFNSKEEAQAEIDRLTRLEDRMQTLEGNVEKVEQGLQLMSNNGVKSAQGAINLLEGIRNENKVHRKLTKSIKKRLGIFKNYRCLGSLKSVNVSTTNGRGCQIDIFGEMEDLENNRKVNLVAEVKNRKAKVSSTDVEKFIATILLAKQKYGVKDVVAVYVSTSGFSKPAQEMLRCHNISFNTSVDKLLVS